MRSQSWRICKTHSHLIHIFYTYFFTFGKIYKNTYPHAILMSDMTKEELWQNALTEIELNISKASFVTWFRNTSIIAKKDGGVIISAPNGFSKEWLENKFNKLVLKTLRSLSPDIKEFSVLIQSKKPQSSKLHRTDSRDKLYHQASDQLNFEQFDIDKETNLNPKYRFHNYIIGSSNELAHAAAMSIVQNPGKEFNPFFVYGGVGLGKTHLLHAIGNEFKDKVKDARILYINAETFTNEFINAVRAQTLESFRSKYRPIDTLIIDDVQFIAHKERTQEEFFHTFNALYAHNKQIVISSDKPPQSIDFIDERLKSRFEGGMVVDIGYPEYEMRLTILKAKAKERGVELEDEIFDYIANHIHSNIRELEGALNIIIASGKASDLKITIEKAKKSLAYIIKKPRKSVGVKKILKCIADFYEIPEKEIISQNRRREVAHPRQVMMYLMREEMKCSYPLIGSRLGGRDHTTVIHACNKISESLKKNDEQLAEEINLLKQEIYSS